MSRLAALRERLRLSLWFVPTLLAVASGVLAVLLLAVDQALQGASVPVPTFGGTAEGARSILSAIAQSMLAFTGLVFSITMLVLQQASAQLSPRVMRTFLRDRGNQVVLGLFIGTLVYSLLVLSAVRSPADGLRPFVPGLAVWCGFLFLLASIAAFVWYIDHMAHAIRASTVITNIWAETRTTVDRLYPDRRPPSERGPVPDRSPERTGLHAPLRIKSRDAGVVVSIDEDRIVEAAAEADRMVEVLHPVGDFVPDGAPLADLWGAWDRDASEEVRGAIVLAPERTMAEDVGFGLRQLTDIALRALSPAVNDPTTAVQALDRIHDLLRRMATRSFGARQRSIGGHVRLVVPTPTFDEFVGLALDEIILAGRDQLQVADRLQALLDDVAEVAPPDRQSSLRRRRSALSTSEVLDIAG